MLCFFIRLVNIEDDVVSRLRVLLDEVSTETFLLLLLLALLVSWFTNTVCFVIDLLCRGCVAVHSPIVDDVDCCAGPESTLVGGFPCMSRLTTGFTCMSRLTTFVTSLSANDCNFTRSSCNSFVSESPSLSDMVVQLLIASS